MAKRATVHRKVSLAMSRVPLARRRAQSTGRATSPGRFPRRIGKARRATDAAWARARSLTRGTGRAYRVKPPARDDLSLLRTRAFAEKTSQDGPRRAAAERAGRASLRARRREARDPGVRPARRIPALHQTVVHARPPGRIRARRVRRGVAGTRGADPERAGRHQRRRRAGDIERRERERRGAAGGRGARTQTAPAAPGGVRQAGWTVRPLRRCRYVPRRLPFAFFVRHRRSRFVSRETRREGARGGGRDVPRAPETRPIRASTRLSSATATFADDIPSSSPPSPRNPRNADSPQWRRGPASKPMLCNACGTRYRRTNTLGPSTPVHRAGAVVVPKKRSPPESPSGLNPAKKRCADEGLGADFGRVGTGVRA